MNQKCRMHFFDVRHKIFSIIFALKPERYVIGSDERRIKGKDRDREILCLKRKRERERERKKVLQIAGCQMKINYSQCKRQKNTLVPRRSIFVDANK